MAQVGDAIRDQYQVLTGAGIKCTLEWNPGNHFQQSEERTAKAFLWFARQLAAAGEKPCL